MKLNKKLTLFTSMTLLTLTSTALITSCSNSTNTQNLYRDINVISTNDMHGRLEKNEKTKEAGIEAVNGYVKSQAHDLLLDAGDLTQGTALNDVDKGKTMAEITKILGYDAIAVGNHEFDFGLENILDTVKNYNPNFLSSNVRYKDDNQRVFTATKIKTLANGLKVGIIGLTTPETAYKTHPKNVEKLKFTDLVEETKKEINQLEQANINFIVVVSHVGEYDTVPLAQKLENKIDLIIDGHSHRDVKQTVGTTQIIQTGEYTKALRKSTFDFNNETGFIENFKSDLVEYDELVKFEAKADPQVKEKIAGLKKIQEEEFSKVVIENSPYNLNGEKAIVRAKETNLGDLVTDAMFWEAKKAVNDVNFAITNPGGIRSSLKAGRITKKDTYSVFPFGNKLVVLEAKGDIIRKAFDRSVISNVGAEGANSGALLQVSENVKLTQNQDKSWKYEIKNQSGQFEELNDSKTYKFATQDFTQSGGDGYDMFKNLKELFSGTDLKGIIEEYLKTLNDSTWKQYEQELPKKRLIFL